MKQEFYFSEKLFDNKTAVITGGGSGINLGIAKYLARHGANIAICGRTKDKLQAAAAELKNIGSKVYASPVDVREFAGLEEFFDKVEKTLGRPSVVIAGAAGNFLSPAEALSPNGFKTVIDIDLIGSFNTAKAAFPHLKSTSGSMVFISAGQAFTPYEFQAHAGAAKAGIDQMMKNLALEWGRYGIRVNSIVPGPIDGTAGLEKLTNEKEIETFVRSIPLQRLGKKDDIGALVSFLCSPLATYLTGARIDCDGGQNLPGSGQLNHSVRKMFEGAIS